MSDSVATVYPSLAYDGELTFAGLLQKYFVERDSKHQNTGISRNWNQKTALSCQYDYERRLLPCLYSLCKPETPAHELTEELFEQVLQALADEHHYSDGTVEHYRHLIFLVYQAGVDHDHYPDTLFWQDPFDEDISTEAEKEVWRVKTMTRLRKSFSIEEELRIIHWFSSLQPETAMGEEIGLALMFTLGLRNNEACGANFSSIHLLHGHPDISVFDMLQSTKLNSSEVKSGGKTSNAPRTLLMMKPVVDFIQRRKDYLMQLLKDGALILPEDLHAVEDLPIVCKGLSFSKRASSRELAAAGRDLFKRIGIDRSELASLFQILCSSDLQNLKLEEKEPTTYLFRRNCATHLYQLGFSPSEIQYWMGHEIEDPFTQRSFFADPDQIYALKGKWDRHPVLSILCGSSSTAKRSDKMLPVKVENSECMLVSLPVNEKQTFLVCAEVQEPLCEITVSAHCDAADMRTSCQLIPKTPQYARSASVSETINRAYHNKSERFRQIVKDN